MWMEGGRKKERDEKGKEREKHGRKEERREETGRSAVGLKERIALVSGQQLLTTMRRTAGRIGWRRRPPAVQFR